MIILFSAGGRTGNQLFQLSHAMSARKEKEWLVTFEFGKTKALLSAACRQRWLNVESQLLRIVIETIAYPFVYHLFIRTGIITHLHDRENNYTLLPGRIRGITVMKGYFKSSPQHSSDLAGYFRLRGSLSARMKRSLSRMARDSHAVFVHIRRTDFKHMERILPDQYYRDGIRILQERERNLFFVFVGDDPDYAEMLFKDTEPKFVSRLSFEEDLALMSLCSGGVLSNSTFAWWGAFFGNGSLGYVVPRFWAGFAKNRWHPPEIKADFMTDFVDVHVR